LYVYDNVVYNDSREKLEIVCKKHGVFHQLAHAHLRGNGCPLCGDVSQSDSKILGKSLGFIEICQKVHGDKYDYSKVMYTGAFNKIIIGCPIHGDFLQSATHHKQGNGCPKCKNSGWGWSKTNWIGTSKDGNGMLYVLKCYNNVESFFKVGITTQDVKQRYAAKSRMPYNYQILYTVIGRADKIFDTEKIFLRKLKDFKGDFTKHFKLYR